MKKRTISCAHLIESRRAEVHALQQEMGMQPRSDSRLTEMYARGEADPEYWNAHVVAHELVMVDRIHRETIYGAILEQYLRYLADASHRAHPRIPWSELWRIVRFYGTPMLKLYALRKAGYRLLS